MDERVRAVLAGQMPVEKLPESPPRVVRIYVSCTPTDMIQERNALMQQVYPKLREYCKEKHGIELQMVDLRWGVLPGIRDDHNQAELFLQELERCQRVSAGPSFVALIGQRYGDRPLPATIPEHEYEVLRNSLRRNRSRETRDAGMLDHWYFKDTNAIPPVYVLQPISSVISDFNEMNDPEVRKAAQEQWLHTENSLRKLLQKGAELCHKEGSMDGYSKHKYFMGEFENELRHGIENAPRPRDTAFVFMREIEDLKNYVTHKNTPKFMDIRWNWKEEKLEIDSDSQRFLYDLKNGKVPAWMGKQNIDKFSILWRFEKVVHPDLHKAYINDFCDKFHDTVIRLVDKAAFSYTPIPAPPIFDTVLPHWLITQRKCRDFFGREEIMDRIYAYVTGHSKQPLVLHGQSGCGKTCVFAKAQEEVPQWVPDCTTIVRYLGINAESADIRQVIYGVCHQLALLEGEDEHHIPTDYKALLKYFFDLLEHYPEDRHLVLFFDSLETLNPEHNAHYLVWLPEKLNPNVKIVLSTLPEKHDILDRLRTEVIKNPNYFIEVPPLSVDNCVLLMEYYLQRVGRQISDDQLRVVRRAFECCSLPLFVRLTVEEVTRWRSYTKPALKMIVNTIQQAIGVIFDQLEAIHGKTLVSHSLTYLTASATGLSDGEMEDLLSLDDMILDEIYRTWHPQVRRIPPLVWVRLRADLEPFLFQREVDGVVVSFWNHREFVEAAKQRYLADEEMCKRIYSEMANYFSCSWHGRPKPFNFSPAVAKSMGLSSTASSADRLVLSQPLTFVGSDGTTRYNKRKYDQMPRTLYLSGRLNELNKMAFFNYLWLYNKSKALSIQHIIATFALNPGTESNLVKGALQACQPVILKNMNNMAAELTGRLLTYYASHPNIRHLIQQCDVEGLQHSALVPAFPYHQVPGGPLQHTLESPTPLQFFQLLGSDSRYLLAKERSSQNILVFDLATGEWKYDIQASAGDMHLTPDGSMIVLLDHVTEMSVKIHRSDTGKYVGQLIPLNHTTGETSEKYKLGRMSLSNEFLCIIATFEKSYLCIASVNECKFIEVVNLNGKASVCTITPDSRFVFTNSAETLMSYDLFTLEHVCSLPLEHRPNHVVFTREGHRGFVSNLEENVITVLHAKEGYVDLTYKISLTELLKGDQISDLVVSHNEKYLLVRGNSNLVIYGVKNEKVLSCFGRPSDTPVQFKLPQRSLTDLNFTQAKFSQDDQYVLATIFRNIYIIDVLSGNLVTKLQSPMGIITSLLLPDKRKQIVTHIENSDVIHVWNLDDAIKHVDTLDRLTGRIQEVLVTKDNTVSFVRCHNSDEVGVIDMSTGQLCDLLTHESPLTGLSITTDGRYAFVSVQPKRPGITNKIWHMEERKIIHEFGEVGGYSVPLHNVSTIISVCQKEIDFKAPYYISLFKFEEDRVVEVQCDLTLNFVLSKPFVTKEDRYLIVLTADEYNEYKAEYNSPAICAFSLENDFAVASYSPADLRSCVNVKRMLDVRPHESNPYAVIVLYSCAAEEDEYSGVPSGYTSGIGFLILDVCSGAVIHVCDTFFPPDVDLSRILINQDVTLCMDAQSHIYDITTGFWKCQLVPTGTCPQRFALNGKAVIYYEDQEVYVIRVEDGKEIARCDVHMPITCVEVCHDQRTIVVGCSDGAVSAYVLIDERYDNAKEIVKTIPSRQLPLSTDIDGRTSRSWDKVESSAPQTPIRLPSALSLGQSEKEMLRKIKPVDRIRPQSDTLIYLNARSKTCSVM